jgi:aspartyl-tRNA(Asn)/glutamyl-tRNA(Gln) amidotransferase subunit A
VSSSQENRDGRRAETLRGLRIAWLPQCANILDPQIAAACTAAMTRAEELGTTVEMIELDLVSIELAFLVILESALAARLFPHLECFRDRLDPSLVTTVEKGLRHSAVAPQLATFSRTDCFGKVQALLDHDGVASPTLSAPPLSVDEEPHGRVSIAGRDAGSLRAAWYPYTFAFNLTGHLPCRTPAAGLTAGLPIALQLVGRWHEVSFLLGVAGLLEQHLPQAGVPAGRCRRS